MCALCLCVVLLVSSDAAWLLFFVLPGLSNCWVVSTNREKSPPHRHVPERGKYLGNSSRRSHPQPSLPQRIPSQSVAVLETTVTTWDTHTPGVWWEFQPGGSRQWRVQVKQGHLEVRYRWITNTRNWTCGEDENNKAAKTHFSLKKMVTLYD